MDKEIVVSEIILCHKFYSPPRWVSYEYINSRQRHGLVYVMEGRAFYQMSGQAEVKSFTASEGDILYFTPDTSYITRCYENTPFVHMTVNFQLTDKDALHMLPTCMTPANGQKIPQIFTRLISEWSSRHEYYQVPCMKLLYDLIGALLKESDREHDSYRKKLAPALRYLEEHFCESFSERELTALCGISETYFRRLFKKIYKETSVEYRSRLRIGKACDLLLSGMYSVKEISTMCGYEDPAYFSRAFKKIMGKSPVQFRKVNVQ